MTFMNLTEPTRMSQTNTFKTAQVVDILPTDYWYEKDIMGTITVKAQHQGLHEFTLVEIPYDYAYTSNSGQLNLLQKLCEFYGFENLKQRDSAYNQKLMNAKLTPIGKIKFSLVKWLSKDLA